MVYKTKSIPTILTESILLYLGLYETRILQNKWNIISATRKELIRYIKRES